MASLIRPSKDKDIVGRFNPHGHCKKHPKHRQSPGVCSLCLRDKLSQLSTTSSSSSSSSSRKITSLSSSSSSSSLSSYDSSSCSSPTTLPFPLEPTNSFSIFLFNAKNGGVLKSKSMSVVATRRRKTREGDDDGGNKKSVKKSGFWSKLLHPKTKRSMEEKIKANTTKQLVHTRSLIQTVT